MRTMRPFNILSLVLSCMSLPFACRPAGTVTALRCEYLVEPVSIDVQSPRFTWEYSGAEDFVQSFFRVTVAGSREGLADPDIWDSGEIRSAVPFCRMPDTGALVGDKEYFWQVTAWNEDASRVLRSRPSRFSTAMMDRSDWKAVWISDGASKDLAAAPMFRKRFEAGKGIASAKLFASAAAYATVSLNGRPVSDTFLEPGYTHYDKRNLYAVTEVTGLVKEGGNVLTAVLGNGFYNAIEPVATWQYENAPWRNRARFILELHIRYADGSTQVVATDGSWKTSADGPYVSNNIYAGDTYDAGKEMEGWEDEDYDDTSWKNAVVVPDPSPLLVAQKMPSIRAEKEIAPVCVRSFGDSVHVFDFGRNISGLCRLRVQGKRGTEVSLAHGELVKQDGRLEPGNINIYFNPLPGYEFQTDRYILKGGGEEEWTPSFCYHGFRYAEVRTSVPMRMDASSLTALYFHTDLQSVGSFACSDPMLDTLWEMTRRTYFNNLMSIPTDCPQREKNGWTADAFLSQEVGLLNFDSMLFYEKWLDDFIDNQRPDGRISGIIPTGGWGYDDWIGPVWDAAMFMIPYNLYLYSGDDSALRKMWPVCRRYLEYLRTREDGSGLVTFGIGDWLPYASRTPTEFTSSLFYYYDNRLMEKFALILGEPGERYARKADTLQALVNRKFYDKESGLYASGTQAGQAAALFTGVVPEAETRKVAGALEKLVRENDCCLDFGSLGAKTVLRMLTKYGFSETAFHMASRKEHPSWLAWIGDGLTTLPETWTMSPDFRDASLDHIFFGDISAWLVNDIAGIRADEDAPGFRRVLIAPHFVDGLSWVRASYSSVRGEVCSGWKKSRDGRKVTLEVKIPDNTTAVVTAGGKTVTLGAGRHTLEFPLP